MSTPLNFKMGDSSSLYKKNNDLSKDNLIDNFYTKFNEGDIGFAKWSQGDGYLFVTEKSKADDPKSLVIQRIMPPPGPSYTPLVGQGSNQSPTYSSTMRIKIINFQDTDKTIPHVSINTQEWTEKEVIQEYCINISSSKDNSPELDINSEEIQIRDINYGGLFIKKNQYILGDSSESTFGTNYECTNAITVAQGLSNSYTTKIISRGTVNDNTVFYDKVAMFATKYDSIEMDLYSMHEDNPTSVREKYNYKFQNGLNLTHTSNGTTIVTTNYFQTTPSNTIIRTQSSPFYFKMDSTAFQLLSNTGNLFFSLNNNKFDISYSDLNFIKLSNEGEDKSLNITVPSILLQTSMTDENNTGLSLNESGVSIYSAGSSFYIDTESSNAGTIVIEDCQSGGLEIMPDNLENTSTVNLFSGNSYITLSRLGDIEINANNYFELIAQSKIDIQAKESYISFTSEEGSISFTTRADSDEDFDGEWWKGLTFDEIGEKLTNGSASFMATSTITLFGLDQVSIVSGGNLVFMGEASFNKTLTVTGATKLDNTLTVTGATVLNNTLTISGLATLNSLTVNGVSTLNGDVVLTSHNTQEPEEFYEGKTPVTGQIYFKIIEE